MKRFITLSIILLVVAMPLHRAQADNLKPLDFDPLALLVGEWQGKDPEREPMTASYQSASGGTSLVEMLTMAEKPTMKSMYHADKGEFMPNHYCALGNQPRMHAAIPKGDAKRLPFNFVEVTNLATRTDAHRHNISFSFQDRNHFSQEWVLGKDGKELPHRLEFALVK
jgi:hypothetical protein